MSTPTPTDLITVTVKQQPVEEGGRQYLKGQSLKVTAARAKELADFVILPPPPKPAAAPAAEKLPPAVSATPPPPPKAATPAAPAQPNPPAV